MCSLLLILTHDLEDLALRIAAVVHLLSKAGIAFEFANRYAGMLQLLAMRGQIGGDGEHQLVAVFAVVTALPGARVSGCCR
ncbi:hypothetical protein C9397_18270 [Xanthomonas vasicola pv. vasculorum]|uniref:Uncharacterized protein n=2 Tax=Xanthomonas vasicola pv. vasculorum TaxID=325776 RepID=A0A836ZTD7_XANVA|nr:hypothetical protein C7V42_21180 [Xanthomonas vasicola pv. vasculorum]AZR28624.1 hypothetical protein NX80_021630 [Xanthomonas vasicola pv. arecae]AZR36626.1 hypothetical protein NX08_021570 [Xanthomonas vasicola]KEZ95047.1 hypothetical protein A11M_0123495 [Xanthomonas vasicola pv. vasculorum NCPPB 895]KFA35453.1 hypothetical protein KWI_0113340 [Xanthomonas vasicola pv. vasculorum NCPPB 206]